tara:strand:+ start:421 stop:1767 length:1347 start_codon:yes stop_codon:yes gene_type:complete
MLNNLYKIIPFLTLTFVSILLLFNRPFVGIYIFGTRIGEILIAASLLLAVLIPAIFLFSKTLKINKEYKILTIIYGFIGIFFIASIFYHQTSIFRAYTYKTSTYIWTIGYFYFSLIAFNNFDKLEKYKNYFLSVFMILPFIHYIFSTGFFPNFIIDFFNSFSDKFEFTKASDIMLSLVIANLLNFKYNSNKIFRFSYFGFSVSLLLPLLLFMSRGSFVSGVLFYIFSLYYFRKYFYKNLKVLLLLFIISSFSFIISLYNVSDIDFSFNWGNEPPPSVIETVEEVSKKKETRKAFLSLYIQDGRLMSKDNTTNWRLDIWQDVFEDLRDKNLIVYGYGHNEIIPVMTDPSAPGRLGRDGLNENVHNYFINILARGGLIQFFAFFAFYISLLRIAKRKFGNYGIFLFMIPILFNSTLDMSMEGVQYPIVYYVFLGLLISTEDKSNLINYED